MFLRRTHLGELGGNAGCCFYLTGKSRAETAGFGLVIHRLGSKFFQCLAMKT